LSDPYPPAEAEVRVEVTEEPWWVKYWPYLALAGGLAGIGLIAGVVLTQRSEVGW